MQLDSAQIHIDKGIVFRLLDCHKENPLYEEMESSYESLLEDIKKYCHPKGLLDFAVASELDLEKEYGENAVFAMVLYTIGEEISRKIDSFFEKNEYFDGMLLDAMADSCLFSMEEEWRDILIDECKKRKMGIARRMEAPADFSIETQKKIWQLTNGEKLGVTMTSGGMFDPIKTICLLFLLTNDVCQNNAGHDCKKCSNELCRLRRFG